MSLLSEIPPFPPTHCPTCSRFVAEEDRDRMYRCDDTVMCDQCIDDEDEKKFK